MELLFKNESFCFYRSEEGRLVVTDHEGAEQDVASLLGDPAFANVVANANRMMNEEPARAVGDQGSGEDERT